MNFRLYVLQRVTALVMVPLIIGHVAIIIYATRRGVSAVEIFSRTRGSFFWASYYGAFVIAATVHAVIGLRTVLQEWGPLAVRRSPRGLDAIACAVGVLLLILGLRAIYALVM